MQCLIGTMLTVWIHNYVAVVRTGLCLDDMYEPHASMDT